MNELHWHWIALIPLVIGHVLHWLRQAAHSQEIQELKSAFDFFVNDTRSRLGTHDDDLREHADVLVKHTGALNSRVGDLAEIADKQTKQAQVHNALVAEFRQSKETLAAHEDRLADHEHKLGLAKPRRGRPAG
jgi:hypothetical protein